MTPVPSDLGDLARLVAERIEAAGRRPFVIGIGGSVAVGKSTTARALQELLAAGPGRPRVEVVPTDGFLLTNAALAERGLTDRKGFPESYDRPALLRFVEQVRRGEPDLRAPIYSHITYDVVAGEEQVLDRPDVVIVEGLTVLETGAVDLGIYVDADEADVERWFVDRVLHLRATTGSDPRSFFHGFAAFGDDELRVAAHHIWTAVNLPNLREHILPGRAGADIVVRKAADHSVERIEVRPAS